MTWYAFPTICSKIVTETINAILHEIYCETHMEVTVRTAEQAQALSSKQGQQWQVAAALAQSHPEHLQGWSLPYLSDNFFQCSTILTVKAIH